MHSNQLSRTFLWKLIQKFICFGDYRGEMWLKYYPQIGHNSYELFMNFSKIFITLKLSHRLQFSENQTIYYIVKLHFQLPDSLIRQNYLFFKDSVKLTTGETKTVKCILLSGTFDALAKCLFHNVVQFNGYFGCPYCLHPGTTIKMSSSGAGHSHVCTCDRETNGKTKQRTHEETVCLAIEAEKLKKQGKSNTVVCTKFDVISRTAIDYMHSVLLGVVKMLLTLWTDKF